MYLGGEEMGLRSSHIRQGKEKELARKESFIFPISSMDIYACFIAYFMAKDGN